MVGQATQPAGAQNTGMPVGMILVAELRAKPVAHVRLFFKHLAHLQEIVSP